MKIKILFFLFFIGLCSVNAQVGIGNTNPNTNSLLDIGTGTDTKGVLLPRVLLTGTANVAPLTAHVAGMMVYNKATAGDVTPGFYYNDGSKWIRIAPGESDDWKLTGNTGTTAGTNFIGTTDNVDLIVKTNNTENIRVTSTGKVGVGKSVPTYKFSVKSDVANRGVMNIENADAAGFAGIYFSEGNFDAALVPTHVNYRGHIGHVNASSTLGGAGTFQVASGDRDLTFGATFGGNNFTERMRIAKNGNVSIGLSGGTNFHKLQITTNADDASSDNALRLIGVGNNGSGARLNFGDGDFVYLDEDADDHLVIHASGGIKMQGKTTIENVLRLTPRISAPTNPTEGDVYYESSSTRKKLRVWTGAVWEDLN